MVMSWLFFYNESGDHRDLHSFPTRRSSDLGTLQGTTTVATAANGSATFSTLSITNAGNKTLTASAARVLLPRSEEHTSELQSHVNLVCRLLLEKKNKHLTPTSQGRRPRSPL